MKFFKFNEQRNLGVLDCGKLHNWCVERWRCFCSVCRYFRKALSAESWELSRNQSGGVVAGATVTIVDTDRGVSTTLVTNEPGEYNAPTLNPGSIRFAPRPKGSRPSSARTSVGGW